MSEAPTPVAAAAPAEAPALTTSLTTGAPAAPAAGETPAIVEGGAAAAAGQGDDAGKVAQGDAPAVGEAPKAGEGGDAPGAPEQYADFTMPDGFALEGDMLTGVTAIAKAHNMTQEQAQALVDLGVKQAQAVTAGYADLATKSPVILADHWAQEWSKQTAADAVLGGKNLPQTVALSHRVFATFGSPELASFLNETGLAHHPELHRMLVKIGGVVSEDTLVTPQGGAAKNGGQQDVAKRLYPGMN